MENIVYLSEHSKAVLTTDSPLSSYGMPVLRIIGIGSGDYGPADMLPSGVSAAQVCCLTYHLQDQATQERTVTFCRQDLNGPQPTRP